jgi:hypothetical protein
MDILRYFQFLQIKKTAHHLVFALISIFLLLTAFVYFLPTTIIDLIKYTQKNRMVNLLRVIQAKKIIPQDLFSHGEIAGLVNPI